MVLASGSKASYIKTQQKGYNDYLRFFNFKCNELSPSLVGFKVKENVKAITGVRTKALVSLYQNDKLIHSEYGEVNSTSRQLRCRNDQRHKVATRTMLHEVKENKI